MYNTDKERALYQPQVAFYEQQAAACADVGVAVDLFVAPHAYADVTTIGALSACTGGQVTYYPSFHARKDGECFQNDLYRTLTRYTGFDGVMTVRTSASLRVVEYYGHAYRRLASELELPVVDSDKTFAVRLAHDGVLKDTQEAAIQCALLYTTAEGQRRVRVHTISVPVTNAMGVIFRNADVDAVVNMSLKQVVGRLPTQSLAASRAELLQACVEILHVYRKKCASATSAGQLILPESLKLLPLYTLHLLKHPLLADGQRADDRAYLMTMASTLPTFVAIAFVYPHLFSLHDLADTEGVVLEDGRILLPLPRALVATEIYSDGLFVLDNGRSLFMLVGEEVNPQLVDDVLEEVEGKLALRPYVPDDGSHPASRVNLLLDVIRRDRPTFAPVVVCRRVVPHARVQDEANLFMGMMFEDGIGDKDKEAAVATPDKLSYVALLCFIHRKIQEKAV